MQSVDGIISGFEEQLAKDGAILDVPKALQNHNPQLQVLYLTMQPKSKIFNSFMIDSCEGTERGIPQRDPNL